MALSFITSRVSFKILVNGGQNEVWIPGGAKYYPPGSKGYGYLRRAPINMLHCVNNQHA